MHIRRLVKAGTASHTVSLPKAWLSKNNLKRGDMLYITERSDKELSIAPKLIQDSPTKPQKEITINIDKKDIGCIQREITAAYINNYSHIILLGSEIDKKSKEIRTAIHDFVALEITEQTGKRIVAKDLLNLNEISVHKTIKRMDMILRSIIKDSITSLHGKDMEVSITYRDSDVNRLYFLLYRILKSALNNQKIAETFGLSNSKSLASWYLTMNLENIADEGKNICRHLKQLGDKKKNRKAIEDIYSMISELYENGMKAYYNTDKDLAHEVARNRIPIFDRCTEFLKNNPTVDIAELMSCFKNMTTMICNIARIVLDEE